MNLWISNMNHIKGCFLSEETEEDLFFSILCNIFKSLSIFGHHYLLLNFIFLFLPKFLEQNRALITVELLLNQFQNEIEKFREIKRE